MQKFDSSDSPLGNLPAKMTSHLKSPRTRFRVEAHLERGNSSRPQRCVTAAAGVLTHGANSSALARVRPVCQCAGRCPSPAAHLPAKMTLKNPHAIRVEAHLRPQKFSTLERDFLAQQSSAKPPCKFRIPCNGRRDGSMNRAIRSCSRIAVPGLVRIREDAFPDPVRKDFY